MSPYRRKASSTCPPPAFDIARRWRHPFVLFMLSALLCVCFSLLAHEFLDHTLSIASILVLDVSESALDNTDWSVKTVCDRYQQYLRPGDYQTDIWFADEARVVFDGVVKNSPVPYACQPTAKELADHQIGQKKGTSLHRAVLRISDALQEIPATHSDAPVLVTVVLHELDAVAPSNDFEGLAQEMTELADAVGWIRVLGPDGETATRLRQLLMPIPKAQFCPLNNVERDVNECSRVAFEVTRNTDT